MTVKWLLCKITRNCRNVVIRTILVITDNLINCLLIPCVCSVTRSCPTLCDSTDCSLPGSSVHGILQARWKVLPFPPPGDLPHPGIEPESSRIGRRVLYHCPPWEATHPLASPFFTSWCTSGCFRVLAITNSVAVNIGVHLSLLILVSSVCMPSRLLGLLGHMAVLFSVFKESPHCSP